MNVAPRRAARAGGRPAVRLRLATIVVLALLAGAAALFVPIIAVAQPQDAGDDASTAADARRDVDAMDAADAEVPDPAVAAIRETTKAVRDLAADRLSVDIEPQTLFPVSLEDDVAIDVDAARLRALLRQLDADAAAADAGARRDAAARRPGNDAGHLDAGMRELSPELWQARVELDRARLAFYALPASRRHELLAELAKRKIAAAAPSEAEQRAKEAATQREKALAAARSARSEAERIVSEEYARLLDVEKAQAAFETKLAAERQDIEQRREVTLGWQRRARDARAPTSTPEAVDKIYDELRKALRGARDELDAALDDLSRATSDVRRAGADPLADLQTTVDTSQARAERARVEATATRLVAAEKGVHEEQASQLFDEIDALNSERLALLPFLSSSKRSAITGFTEAGADQAASEVRQLSLIARYHRHAATEWLASMRHLKEGLGLRIGGALLVGFEWVVAIGAFFWARRRVPIALRAVVRRAQEHDRLERLTSPSLAKRLSGFALQVHQPVEWLALAVLLSWLLPTSAKGLLEIQLVTVIVQWVLGGALVVVVVNALAGAEPVAATAGDGRTAALRLRSLKLIGRVVVAFGLVLVLTSRLVGPGTIYHWVLSTCWLASVVVFLVLIRWWREVVFARANRSRKKSAFEKWILANRQGWKSFLAATVGGVYVFGRGAVRSARSWVGRFNVTRRLLAYLFRRELGKLEAARTELVTARIPDAAFELLGPEKTCTEWVAADVEAGIEALAERLREKRGGVVAVVGPRGMGKSALLRRLHGMFSDTLLMIAPTEGAVAFRATLAHEIGAPDDASLGAVARSLSASPKGRAFLLDDAHRFVQPVMGGLATFDALLAAASESSRATTWVFALDEVIWLFLQRARQARPLFDEIVHLPPWREEQIIELLRARTASAGLTPTFERLLEKLPPNADEIDRQEALEQRAASYYRLLWDYAAGNPGIALHMWRRSLGADADGSTHVRFFQAPDGADLELLPDPAIFVLRAVLQLAPASAEHIGRATMLNAADVADALRYALARTYVERTDGRYTITWTWLRAITLFLQRRHLLVTQ